MKPTQTPPKHSFTIKYRAIPWMVCRHCGLIRLNNEATRNAPCDR